MTCQRATGADSTWRRLTGNANTNGETMIELIVTRHPALVDYLREIGMIPDGARVIAHATVAEVRGRHVCGVLPLHVAAECASVTMIPLDIPSSLRGVELTLEQVREFAREPRTFVVREPAPDEQVDSLLKIYRHESWLDGREDGCATSAQTRRAMTAFEELAGRRLSASEVGHLLDMFGGRRERR